MTIAEFAEKTMGLKLLDCQKKFLEALAERMTEKPKLVETKHHKNKQECRGRSSKVLIIDEIN